MAGGKEETSLDRHGHVLPHTGDGGGRTYYLNIPIRPLSRDVPDEHLDRLTLYYTIYGVVFGAVGAVAIVFPLVLGVGVTQLIAWLLILGGGVTLLQFFLVCGAPGTTAFLLLAALHLAVGIWMLLQPIAGSTAATFVLSGWFLIHGVIKILMACQVRSVTSWPAVLTSGFISIVLAFIIMSLTPRFGLVIVGIAFGGDLVITGISLLLIALMAFLGKGHRSVTDAQQASGSRLPLLTGGVAASSA